MKSIYFNEYIEIITRLRTVRIDKGITQSELACKLNTNQSFVSKVENCERRLDIIEFFNWTSALNIDFTTIIPNKYLILKEYNKNG